MVQLGTWDDPRKNSAEERAWLAREAAKQATQYIATAPTAPQYGLPPGSGSRSSGGDGGAAAAQAAANAAAKASARKENENTRTLADQQFSLIGGFGTQRDIKLQNILKALQGSDQMLLKGYADALGGLKGNAKDNDSAEADTSFSNVANAVRERQDILSEAASMGAGESDLLRSQLAALRNYTSNQNETNRSFFDTLRSINNSITGLNTDTATGRTNLYNQAESDRESAWANYYNQVTDTWTQIANIENANTNVGSATSEAYNKGYGQAGSEAAKSAGSGYSRQSHDVDEWAGKGSKEERALASSNRAASVNLGGPMKKPEGATLRKW